MTSPHLLYHKWKRALTELWPDLHEARCKSFTWLLDSCEFRKVRKVRKEGRVMWKHLASQRVSEKPHRQIHLY